MSTALTAIVAGVVLVLIFAVSNQRDATRTAGQSEEIARRAGQLELALLQVQSGQRGYAIDRRADALAQWRDGRRRIPALERSLRRLVAMDEPRQQARARRLTRAVDAYVAGVSVPVVTAAMRSPEKARALLAQGAGDRRLDRLDAQFDRFVAREEQLASARRADARDQASRALWLGVACLVALVALAAVFTGYFSRTVVGPIRRVALAARGLAAGDLSARVPRREGGSEVAELGRAFNTMAASLQDQRGRLEEQRTQLEAGIARLEHEKERIARYLAFGQRVALETETGRLGPVMLEELCELTGADRAVLYASDIERDDEPAVLATHGLPERAAPPAGAPPLAAAMEGSEPRRAKVSLLAPHRRGDEIAVPLVHGDRAVGLALLCAPGRLSDEAVRTVRDIAPQAAATLSNALALNAARRAASVIRAVLDATPDAIALLDSSGRTVIENPPMKEVRAALVESVRSPRGGFRTRVSVHGADSESRVNDELQLLGTGRTFARYAAPVRDGDGRLIGRLMVLREVTGEREADRLKDEFFALVSHELRTPLTSIIGYLELVLDDEEAALADDHRHYLEVVQRNATRLLRLVGDLLFVAQVEAGKLSLEPGTIDLAGLVEESVEAARPRADARSIALTCEVEELPPLRGDRDRIGQVLDNLITNALKFTPAEGSVVVRARPRDTGAVVEVADTGPGIPPEEQSQLFDRFFRARSATQHAIPGVGLGLTIVKAIVEAHGGEVTVHSEVGRGTTFAVSLPIAEAGEEDGGAPAEEAAGEPAA